MINSDIQIDVIKSLVGEFRGKMGKTQPDEVDCGTSTGMNASNGMRPVHPGEVLREELETLGLSANALSKELSVPANRIRMILNGQRGVNADTALRLARYFGTTPQLWLNLQKTWELRRAEIKAGREIDKCVTPRGTVT